MTMLVSLLAFNPDRSVVAWGPERCGDAPRHPCWPWIRILHQCWGCRGAYDHDHVDGPHFDPTIDYVPGLDYEVVEGAPRCTWPPQGHVHAVGQGLVGSPNGVICA